MLYKKVKLDIKFETDNLVFKDVAANYLPKNTLIRYEIDGVTYKEIIRLEGDENMCLGLGRIEQQLMKILVTGLIMMLADLNISLKLFLMSFYNNN